MPRDLGVGDEGRVDREHAAVDQRGAVEPDRLEVGGRCGGGVRGVDHRGARVLALGAQEVDPTRLGVVGGQQQRQRGGRHRRVAEVALERAHEALAVVALVEVAAERGDLLEQRAVEDLRPLLARRARRSRPPAAGRACRARTRGSRRSRCRRSCRRGRRSGARCGARSRRARARGSARGSRRRRWPAPSPGGSYDGAGCASHRLLVDVGVRRALIFVVLLALAAPASASAAPASWCSSPAGSRSVPPAPWSCAAAR